MIWHPFDYFAPRCIEDAARHLADGNALVIGGGTVLVPLMSLGELVPSRVVDTRYLEIRGVTCLGDDLSVGAAASYDTVSASPDASRLAPLLGHVCAGITGGPQLTGQASFGGSACYGNPASEAPACLTALSARMILQSERGQRIVEAADFFRGPFETDRRTNELLTAMLFPDPGRWRRAAYIKQKHCTSSWPIVTASALADDAGLIRITIGAATVRPYSVELREIEADADRLARLASEAVADSFPEPWSDALANGAYRRRVASALAARIVHNVVRDVPA